MKNTYLLIREIQIHDANARSSPITVGFPAMTSWVGFMHALERNIHRNPELQDIGMKELAVSCHKFHLKAYRAADGEWLVSSTKNPATNHKKLEQNPTRTPEPRAELSVSLLINLGRPLPKEERGALLWAVERNLHRMRIAGGDILGFHPFLYPGENGKKMDPNPSGLLDLSEEDASIRKGLHSLMSGFVLVERRDILLGCKDSLDAMLDALSIHHTFQEASASWETSREHDGWIVPIAVGFKGLTPIGKVRNQRDPDTPHRFTEPVLTMGEFKMPYHFSTLSEIMWHYQYKNGNLYLCVNGEE